MYIKYIYIYNLQKKTFEKVHYYFTIINTNNRNNIQIHKSNNNPVYVYKLHYSKSKQNIRTKLTPNKRKRISSNSSTFNSSSDNSFFVLSLLLQYLLYILIFLIVIIQILILLQHIIVHHLFPLLILLMKKERISQR